MKSDTYVITPDTSVEALLAEVERVALFCKLKLSDAMKLRLLAEEMLLLTERLLRASESEFYVENDGTKFSLCLNVRAMMDAAQKEKLLSVSFTQQNAANKGILGKIGAVFESMLVGTELPYDMNYDAYTAAAMGDGHYTALWSLQSYQKTVSEEKKQEDWDGLEKSIIANMADDVTIGVRWNRAEMIVKISF